MVTNNGNWIFRGSAHLQFEVFGSIYQNPCVMDTFSSQKRSGKASNPLFYSKSVLQAVFRYELASSTSCFCLRLKANLIFSAHLAWALQSDWGRQNKNHSRVRSSLNQCVGDIIIIIKALKKKNQYHIHSLENVIWSAVPSTAGSTPALSGGWPRCSPQLPSSLIIFGVFFLSFKVVIWLVEEIPVYFVQICLLLIWALAHVTGL